MGINESNLEDMEQRLDKVIKLSTVMTEGGRQYVTQQTQFLASLWELSAYFANNDRGKDSILAPLNKLIHALQEIVKLQNGLVDMASKSVTKSLTR